MNNSHCNTVKVSHTRTPTSTQTQSIPTFQKRVCSENLGTCDGKGVGLEEREISRGRERTVKGRRRRGGGGGRRQKGGEEGGKRGIEREVGGGGGGARERWRSHSKTRFPAPSLEKGCRKPVRGFCGRIRKEGGTGEGAKRETEKVRGRGGD